MATPSIGFSPVRSENIYLPDGRIHNVPEQQAARAVEAYDPGLCLGKLHDKWTVFLRKGPNETGGLPFPVLELGEELPHPDLITRKLHQADTHRHGAKIAQRVDRQNQERIREARRKGDQGAHETAEYFDWAARSMKVHPTPRIFVPDTAPRKD